MIGKLLRKRARGESGFTLVEVSITAIIIGIISAGICTSLVLAVQEGPTVQHRSNYAGQASFLVNAISDDVANSTANWPGLDADSWTHCDAGKTLDMRHMPLNDGTSVHYAGTVSANAVSHIGGADIYEFDVTRTLTTGGVDSSATMLTAYCQSGVSLGSGATFVDPTYTLDLSLQAAEGSDTRQLSLTASRRAKLAVDFQLTGYEYNDANSNHAWDSPGESAMSGITIKVWDSAQTTVIKTLTTDANGMYSTSLTAGSYVVCQTTPSGRTQTSPASGGAGVVSCTAGGLGYVVTPAGASNVNFGNVVSLACPISPVPQALDPSTGNWPGNQGPDYWVFVNQGQSIQTAVNNAALPDSSTTGDINGDGFIIIQVVAHDDASSGGSAAQSVVISASYPKKFALLGCSVNLTGGGAGPAIWVKSTASAPTTTVAADSGLSANIYVADLFGGSSNTGLKIDGNGRYLRTPHATSNTSVGISVTGNSNTIYSGYANSNGGNGVTITGDSNTVMSSFNAMSNTGYGVYVSGNSNKLDDVDLGESGTPNTLDGARVLGNSNTLNQVDAYANSGNGIYVSGNTNTLTSNIAGADNKGNGADGYHIVGNTNTLTSNKADENSGDGYDLSGSSTTADLMKNNTSASSNENVGAEFRLVNKITNNGGGNKADGTTVPKTTAPTKCNSAGTQFPSASTDFGASVQVCE